MPGADRIDWEGIKARWGSEVSDLHLAILPKGFAQAVLAIAERFQWEATYRVGGYDFSDWDELQTIVDLGLGGLTDTMRLADVISIWTTIRDNADEVEELLRQLQRIQQTVMPCCPGDATPVPDAIDEETDPVPQVIQDNYGTGDDWGEVWENYMCPLLRQWFTAIDEKVYAPMEVVMNAGLISMTILLGLYVAAMGIGTAVVVGGLSVGTLLFLWEQLVELVGEGAMGDYSDWDSRVDEFICAVRHADGPEGKSEAGRDWIASTEYSPALKLVFWALMDPAFWKRAYSGIGANGVEIIVEGEGCPDCEFGSYEVDITYANNTLREAGEFAFTGWNVTRGLDAGSGSPRFRQNLDVASVGRAIVIADGGLGTGTIVVERVILTYSRTAASPPSTYRLELLGEDGAQEWVSPNPIPNVMTEVDYTYPTPHVWDETGEGLTFRMLANGTAEWSYLLKVRILGSFV